MNEIHRNACAAPVEDGCHVWNGEHKCTLPKGHDGYHRCWCSGLGNSGEVTWQTHPDDHAIQAAPVKKKKVERVRGFQI